MSIDDQLRLSRMIFCAEGTLLILSLYAIKLALFRSAQSWSRINCLLCCSVASGDPDYMTNFSRTGKTKMFPDSPYGLVRHC